MLYYAAPMEGITTYIYRSAHARWYGGIDKYFTPFIANKKMTAREVRDILPENNTGLSLVPQILTNKVSDFLSIAEQLASYGYDSVNLNLGCPSGTVTAKKRGAGFLSEPEALDAFLYGIYEKCPLKISIKTRLGVSDLDEWERLLDVYAKYPVQELIIHTRLLQEFYTSPAHPAAYTEAAARLGASGISLCYNGDIVSAESLRNVIDNIGDAGNNLPCPKRIMIGRGLLRNPALAVQLRQSQDIDTASAICHNYNSNTDRINLQNTDALSLKTLRFFHDEILDGYRQIMSGDLPVLFKMKDLWTYMITGFNLSANDAGKYLKKIRKAERLSEYKIAVDSLFREQRT